jgi:hypothetical protein
VLCLCFFLFSHCLCFGVVVRCLLATFLFNIVGSFSAGLYFKKIKSSHSSNISTPLTEMASVPTALLHSRINPMIPTWLLPLLTGALCELIHETASQIFEFDQIGWFGICHHCILHSKFLLVVLYA